MTESSSGRAMVIKIKNSLVISQLSRRTPEPVSRMTIRALHNHDLVST